VKAVRWHSRSAIPFHALPSRVPIPPFPCPLPCSPKHRTLQKTLEFLQNKRPDLMPRPGFLRQLQALDASLQRVLKASAKGPGDAALRRYSEWDSLLLAPAPALVVTDASLEEELVLVNTFVNSQSAPEDVIRAAQSDTPLPRESPGTAAPAAAAAAVSCCWRRVLQLHRP
jgi:hypothetical protein